LNGRGEPQFKGEHEPDVIRGRPGLGFAGDGELGRSLGSDANATASLRRSRQWELGLMDFDTRGLHGPTPTHSIT
jgi:hypothetical protein